jgi:predicted RecB family nuclease
LKVAESVIATPPYRRCRILTEEGMITSKLLEAYLACPTKCYLQLIGEKCSENNFAAWYQAQTVSYIRAGVKRLEASGSLGSPPGQVEPSLLKKARWQFAFDQTFDVDDLSANIHAVLRSPTNRGSSDLVPIRFVHTNRPSRASKMAAAFDAIVLSKFSGQAINVATIIHGDAWITTKARVAAQTHDLTKAIEKLRALLAAAAPPDLILNRHCPECEFRDRCRKKAIETDDLSLLTGLTGNERARLNRKGIFTVSQLSHTFRPRRRPKRLAAQPEKYHHSLRALALREKKIHIIGKPQLPIHGTPIYFDVESLPDRDFYYLVGIRIEVDGRPTLHSFWANAPCDERAVWTDFLSVVSTVETPILIHYGNFESKFLKKMCDRYGSPPDGSTAAKAIASSFNLLKPIFATVYFPTYSNGLKENARFLGFEWSDTTANGQQSLVWRYLWEQCYDPNLREKLITYNMDDCAALGVVAQALNQLTDEPSKAGDPLSISSEVVRADAGRSPVPKWKPFKSPISDLETINLAAHWDYQRDRVFVRPVKARRQATPRAKKHPQTQRVQKTVLLNGPSACPRCGRKWHKSGRLQSRTVQDFIFGKDSIKRRIIKYEAQTRVCRSCGFEYGPDDLRLHGRHWGWNIVAYFVYSVIGLYIPQLTVQHSINRLFGCRLVRSSLNEFKIKASKLYSNTKAEILDRIIAGKLIHADETSANIKGRPAYVWVLTSLTDVVYILTESREGETVQKLLKEFRGVLVSDFYAAYESIECKQQKCLIHLMRDLNDEILNNPFDEEAKLVALRFSALLKPIVDTIDRRGLRAHFLRKHLREVERFYGFLDNGKFDSDAAAKLKNRFQKNRDKLFTFLRYDGVPWNNNNAEHAVKAFARLRTVVSGSSTKKGVDEYLTLLSVSQTCKYRGIDFLDFVRSGDRSITMFESRRRGLRH